MKTLLLLCLAAVNVAALPFSPPPPGGARTAVFVSDLHLGVGRDPADTSAHPTWHKLEDFRWETEFSDFLERINTANQGKTDLVLLGDVLELWQSLSSTDCHHEKLDENLGCTEKEAEARARRALEQHSAVLAKLAWFSQQGDNRVTIVPGNHDAALAFPSVRDLLLAKIKAPANRLRVAAEGYWWSADGKVFAEHGHQMGSDPNRFDGWPDHPFIENGGVTYLQQPWGEQMVQEVFNKQEEDFPTVDNLSEELLGIKYVLKSQTLLQKVKTFGDLARFVIFQTSWKQSEQGLGGTGDAKDPAAYFDLDAIRESYKATPQRFLVDSVPPDDPLRPALEEALQAGAPLPRIGDLTPEEIRALCVQRLVYNESAGDGQHLPACDTTAGLGAAGQALNDLLPGARDKRISEYLTQIRSDLPESVGRTRQIKHYVYAHTHKEEHFRPFPNTAPFKPEVWNDGAWQRRASPEQLCTILRKKKLEDDPEALRKINPEDLPACYPYVQAQWSEGSSEPKLQMLYWIQEQGKSGVIREDCGFKIDDACKPKEKKKPAPAKPQ